jgi:hypothetical protein
MNIKAITNLQEQSFTVDNIKYHSIIKSNTYNFEDFTITVRTIKVINSNDHSLFCIYKLIDYEGILSIFNFNEVKKFSRKCMREESCSFSINNNVIYDYMKKPSDNREYEISFTIIIDLYYYTENYIVSVLKTLYNHLQTDTVLIPFKFRHPDIYKTLQVKANNKTLKFNNRYLANYFILN